MTRDNTKEMNEMVLFAKYGMKKSENLVRIALST